MGKAHGGIKKNSPASSRKAKNQGKIIAEHLQEKGGKGPWRVPKRILTQEKGKKTMPMGQKLSRKGVLRGKGQNIKGRGGGMLILNRKGSSW